MISKSKKENFFGFSFGVLGVLMGKEYGIMKKLTKKA